MYRKKCETVYKKSVCEKRYRTKYEPYIATECINDYLEECEYHRQGEYNFMEWVAIPRTCRTIPYDNCREVTKHRKRQVVYTVCCDVIEHKCYYVLGLACQEVPNQDCTNQPQEKCSNKLKEECYYVHKMVPVRVSKKIPKKVCNDGYSPEKSNDNNNNSKIIFPQD